MNGRKSVKIEDIWVFVPNRYDTYPDGHKERIAEHVRTLKKVYGKRLHSVHVDRLVPIGDTIRVDGAFSYL